MKKMVVNEKARTLKTGLGRTRARLGVGTGLSARLATSRHCDGMSWFRVEVRKAKDLIIGICMDGEKIEGEEHVRYYNRDEKGHEKSSTSPCCPKVGVTTDFQQIPDLSHVMCF